MLTVMNGMMYVSVTTMNEMGRPSGCANPADWLSNQPTGGHHPVTLFRRDVDIPVWSHAWRRAILLVGMQPAGADTSF